MVIIWLSTVLFENNATGVMVCEQFPFTLFLVCIMTLPPLISCAGPSAEKLGGSQGSRPISETDMHFVWS